MALVEFFFFCGFPYELIPCTKSAFVCGSLWIMVVLPCVVNFSPVAFMLGRSY
jgi:hypothetical protein